MMSDTQINGDVVPNHHHSSNGNNVNKKKKKRKKHTFTPLELEQDEEEVDSLIHETGDFSHVVSTLTLRKRKRPSLFGGSGASRTTHVLGFLRSKLDSSSGFAIRNALFFCLLGGMMLLFLHTMDDTVNIVEDNLEHPSKVREPHQPSFGGHHNVGQVGGATLHDKHAVEEIHHVHLPSSKVPGAVPSLSQENVMNHVGHYWHDVHKSPFASYLYQQGSHSEIQRKFETKMNETVQTWGAWNFSDSYFDNHKRHRPVVLWEGYEYYDAPLDEFPHDAWQKDEAYVTQLWNESRALIGRVKEAIYTEYGHGTTKAMTPEETEQRNALFGVIVDDNLNIQNGVAVSDDDKSSPLPGVAYMSPKAWDALVTKLLHAMITHDYFYVVLAANSKAQAGHGNNFVQSQILQFHYIMEPVFDMMGMKLSSRNMAMSSASTVTSALAGADIYGEADIMIWKPPETTSRKDKTPVLQNGPPDLFNRQAILTGERVPILLTPRGESITQASDGQAWVGNIQEGASMCDEMTDAQGSNLVPACRGMRCSSRHSSWCKPSYDSVCWMDRVDYTPPQTQKDRVPDDNKGHPGYLQHRLEGRKLSLLVLHALEAAIQKWEDGIAQDGFPLQDKHWHVGAKYKSIRETLKKATPSDGGVAGGCDDLLHAFPMLCRTPMHGLTEWTPRRTPTISSIQSIVRPDVPIWTKRPPPKMYKDMDLLKPSWMVPPDQVDVHAIAMAHTGPALKTNEWGEYEDDDNVLDGDDVVYYYQDDYIAYDDDFGNFDDDQRRLEAGWTLRLDSKHQSARRKSTAEEEKQGRNTGSPPTTKDWSGYDDDDYVLDRHDDIYYYQDDYPFYDDDGVGEFDGTNLRLDGKDDDDYVLDRHDDIYYYEDDYPFYDDDGVVEFDGTNLRPDEKVSMRRESNKHKSFLRPRLPEFTDRTNSSSSMARRRTKVEEKQTESSVSDLAPGAGWILYKSPQGFCDGSAQSTCGRSVSSDCLMAGHNDAQGGLLGHAQSGWLIMSIPNVQHGIVLARFDTNVAMKDVPDVRAPGNGWVAEAVEKKQKDKNDQQHNHRGRHDKRKRQRHNDERKQRHLHISSDFEFDYAINGEVTTLSGHEFTNMGVDIMDGLTVWPLKLGQAAKPSSTKQDKGETLELAIRIRSESKQGANLLLSHVYYA